jgi:hypothetical protein
MKKIIPDQLTYLVKVGYQMPTNCLIPFWLNSEHFCLWTPRNEPKTLHKHTRFLERFPINCIPLAIWEMKFLSSTSEKSYIINPPFRTHFVAPRFIAKLSAYFRFFEWPRLFLECKIIGFWDFWIKKHIQTIKRTPEIRRELRSVYLFWIQRIYSFLHTLFNRCYCME